MNVPDRHAATTSLRKQFAAGEVTHSKKLEGAWGDEHGMYFVSSFAFGAADLPADATKHDGQLWYYHYSDQTLTPDGLLPLQRRPAQRDPGWETALGSASTWPSTARTAATSPRTAAWSSARTATPPTTS